MRGEGVRDAVRSDLGGVIDPQANTCLDAGADDQGGTVEIALSQAGEGRRERWYHRAENEGIDVVEREVLPSEQRVDHDGELVLGLVVSGRGPPCRDELGSVVRAKHDVGISDVRGQ